MMQSALLVVAGVAIGIVATLAVKALRRVRRWARLRWWNFLNRKRSFGKRKVDMTLREYILARLAPLLLRFSHKFPEDKRVKWEMYLHWLWGQKLEGRVIEKTWKVYNKRQLDSSGDVEVKSLRKEKESDKPGKPYLTQSGSYSSKGLSVEDRPYYETTEEWVDPFPNLTVKMMEELWRPPHDVSLIGSNWKVSKAQYMDIDWDKVLESKQVAPDMEPWWEDYTDHTDHNPYENVGTESKSDQQEVVADHDTESPSGPDIWWKKAKAIEKAQLEETAEDPVYALIGPPEKVSPESLQRMIEETAKDPDYTAIGIVERPDGSTATIKVASESPPKESPEREVEPLSITLSDELMADPERLQRFMVDLAEVAYGGLPVHILPRSKEDVKIPVQPSMAMGDALRKSEEVRYDRTPLDPPSFLRKDPEPTKVPKDLLQLMIEERAKKES